MAYLVLAPWLPGFLRSPRAYSYPQLIEMFFLYADEGVLGSLTGISSNILMIFILFASFMLHSGVGQFFMDISVALAGRFRGGPGQGGGRLLGALRHRERLLGGRLLRDGDVHHSAHEEDRLPAGDRRGHRGVRLVRRAADAARSWAPAPSSWPS